ncbi:MAG TPA: energy transducer TonB [Pyrinomonadaceae bacterium]|nr:energy transducer TonB [Pyrinomonadaceae bacterium]
MHFRRSYRSIAVLFAILLAATITTAQTKPATAVEWDTFKPENEEFSILMPKDTSTEVSKVPYHKFELSLRLYLSTPTAGPVLGVASVSGIKANVGSELERFNSYADAFKTFFPQKVRKDAIPKMILIAAKPFHGYTGRVYQLTIGDLSGTVNAYVTRKRFYAIAILNTKKDEDLENKFLSSFVIPDKPVEQVAGTEETQDSNASVGTSSSPSPRELRRPAVEPEGGTTNSTAQAGTSRDEHPEQPSSSDPGLQVTPTQPGQKPPRAPISGGMLNGKAIYLPLPEAQVGQPNGVVMVQILIDEQGTVVDAKAVSGPTGLHAAAVNAARLARFMPTVLAGEPVKVSGTLAYNFARSN